MSKGYVPLNTEKNSLGPACFHEWKHAQNKSVAMEGKGDVCPDDLLDNPDVVISGFRGSLLKYTLIRKVNHILLRNSSIHFYYTTHV